MAAALNLQNPGGRRWPDIFGQQSTRRKKLQGTLPISSLLESGQLLTKDLNLLLSELQTKSDEIATLLDYRSEFQRKDAPEYRSFVTTEYKKRYGARNEPLDDGEFDKFFSDMERSFLAYKAPKVWVSVGEIGNVMQDAVSDFCQKVGLEQLDVLERTQVYTCNKCQKDLCTGMFRGKKCGCGFEVRRVNQTSEHSLITIDPSVTTFLKKNMWLEYGIERVYRSLGYDTTCGVYVMGSSGVEHEVDVIAQSPKTSHRVIVECKNRPIEIGDVFKLYGQMSDLGFSFGVIVSTAFLDSSTAEPISRLAFSKNIRVIEGVLEINADALRKALGLERAASDKTPAVTAAPLPMPPVVKPPVTTPPEAPTGSAT